MLKHVLLICILVSGSFPAKEMSSLVQAALSLYLSLSFFNDASHFAHL